MVGRLDYEYPQWNEIAADEVLCKELTRRYFPATYNSAFHDESTEPALWKRLYLQRRMLTHPERWSWPTSTDSHSVLTASC